MPMKIGAGGKPQEYDPRTGRYGYGSSSSQGTTAKNAFLEEAGPKTLPKSLRRKLLLDERASHSNDPGLFEIYNLIQKWCPGCVIGVNNKYVIPKVGRGEVDIETRHLVIEIKSGSGRHFVNQFTMETRYAETRHKSLIIYAPLMSEARKREATRHGFNVVSTQDELKMLISEKEGK